MTPGTKVTHNNRPGIIKRLSSNKKRLFVVFNCGHQWERYDEYEAESVLKCELVLGWPMVEEIKIEI